MQDLNSQPWVQDLSWDQESDAQLSHSGSLSTVLLTSNHAVPYITSLLHYHPHCYRLFLEFWLPSPICLLIVYCTEFSNPFWCLSSVSAIICEAVCKSLTSSWLAPEITSVIFKNHEAIWTPDSYVILTLVPGSLTWGKTIVEKESIWMSVGWQWSDMARCLCKSYFWS